MDFSVWTTSDLQDLIEGVLSDELLKSYSLDAGQAAMVADEASKALYIRQVEEGRSLNTDLVGEITSKHQPGSPSRKLIGEYAISDALSDESLRFAKETLSQGEWALMQIKARLLVREFQVASEESERMRILQCLSKLSCRWAIEELIDQLSKPEAELVEDLSAQNPKWGKKIRSSVRAYLSSMS